jgi:hypothetical protein
VGRAYHNGARSLQRLGRRSVGDYGGYGDMICGCDGRGCVKCCLQHEWRFGRIAGNETRGVLVGVRYKRSEIDQRHVGCNIEMKYWPRFECGRQGRRSGWQHSAHHVFRSSGAPSHPLFRISGAPLFRSSGARMVHQPSSLSPVPSRVRVASPCQGRASPPSCRTEGVRNTARRTHMHTVHGSCEPTYTIAACSMQRAVHTHSHTKYYRVAVRSAFLSFIFESLTF